MRAPSSHLLKGESWMERGHKEPTESWRGPSLTGATTTEQAGLSRDRLFHTFLRAWLSRPQTGHRGASASSPRASPSRRDAGADGERSMSGVWVSQPEVVGMLKREDQWSWQQHGTLLPLLQKTHVGSELLLRHQHDTKEPLAKSSLFLDAMMLLRQFP